MSSEEENDLSNISIDENTPLNSSDLTHVNQANTKRPKSLLRCVVCGDHAFGIIKFEIFSK